MKMKKFVGLILVCMLLMVALIGCSNNSTSDQSAESASSVTAGSTEESTTTESAEGKTFRIGVSWAEMKTEKEYCAYYYFKTLSNELGEQYGFTFEWISVVASEDATKEASNMQDLINQDVDLIVLRCVDAAAAGASITAAQDAGIPVILYDHNADSGNATSYVGVDAYGQAYRTGIEFANILEKAGLKGKGIAIELMGSLSDSNAVDRSKGWAAAEAETGAWKTVVQVNTDWQEDKFKTGIINALAEHPEANCLFIASDYCLPSLILGLEESGRWAKTGEENHIYFATQDVMRDAYQAFLDGYIDCGEFYDVYMQCEAVCETIIDVLNGEEVEPEILIEGRMITQDNVSSLDHLWYNDYDEAVSEGKIEGVSTDES